MDAQLICGGKVGTDGSRICGRPFSACTAQSHVDSRDEDLLAALAGKILVKHSTDVDDILVPQQGSCD